MVGGFNHEKYAQATNHPNYWRENKRIQQLGFQKNVLKECFIIVSTIQECFKRMCLKSPAHNPTKEIKHRELQAESDAKRPKEPKQKISKHLNLPGFTLP